MTGPHGRWLVAAGLIFLAAVVARFWNLGLAPFHNDEGVNGWFTTTLIRSGTWKYDPANYHGPTLFYAALVSTTLFGLNEVGMRLVPALFG
ncbi:MAG TPA: TIGR03663 family protein, partial [Coriobacteriia bacterium]